MILIARNSERLYETKSLLANQQDAEIYPLDITDYSEVESVFDNIRAENPAIHGLVNSAGISTTLPLKLSSPEKISAFLQTNVVAGINLCRLVSKKGIIHKNGGSFVFISSVMGLVGEIGKTMYSLSKGALIAGVRSLALELASKQIRVNTVSPGVIVSPMSENAVYSKSAEAREKIASLHPLGLGKPEDVANAVAFLLSDASRWITGTNLTIDGGYTAR